MYRIDNDTAAAVLPAPTVDGPNPDSYFTGGNPGTGTPATTVDAEWLNMVQEEISNVIEDADAGNTPLDKADRTQLKAAIIAMINAAVPSTGTRGYIDGLILSNNATDPNNDIDFGAGEARSSASTEILSLAATMTKQLDAAWAAGTGNGGLFSGSKANSTCYHCFVIRKDSDGTIDCGFDTSLSAANKPAGYSDYRRVGSVFTDGSGNIRGFIQHGDLFLYKTPVVDASGVTVSTTATLQALTTPSGIRTSAKIKARAYDVSNDEAYVQLSNPDTDDLAVALTGAGMPTFGWETNTVPGNAQSFWQGDILTNTSNQIRQRGDGLGAGGGLWIVTVGYTDLRGKA